MFVSPIFKKQSGALNYVLMNASKTEFAPVMASPDLTSHFPLLHPRTGIPDFALKGEILTPEHLKDTGGTEPCMFMIAVPKMMPSGYVKAWIKGRVAENETINTFESEYGTQRGEWLRMRIKAKNDENIISTVYHRLKTENTLSEHVGPTYASVTLNAGRPDVYITTINSTSSPEEYACI